MAGKSTFRSFSRIVWSRCCRSLFNDITSSFSWLMRMKLSVPPESIDWVMELLMGERGMSMRPALRWVRCRRKMYSTCRTCPRWMASSPVLVSSLESPSGLKTIYGCKENQNINLRPKNSIKLSFSDYSAEIRSFTSASTVPAPAQDSSSHSVWKTTS